MSGTQQNRFLGSGSAPVARKSIPLSRLATIPPVGSQQTHTQHQHNLSSQSQYPVPPHKLSGISATGTTKKANLPNRSSKTSTTTGISVSPAVNTTSKLVPRSNVASAQISSNLKKETAEGTGTKSSDGKRKQSSNSSSSTVYARLSINSLQNFAEAEGVRPNGATMDAWGYLSEDVNYRTRELTYESTKFMKKARRNRLTVSDVNLAAKELGCEAVLGHRNKEQPKVHFLKELKLYCRNEGIVELAPLALSKYPFDSSFSFANKSVDCTVSESKSTSKLNEEALQELIDAVDVGLNTNPQGWIRGFVELDAENLSAVLPHILGLFIYRVTNNACQYLDVVCEAATALLHSTTKTPQTRSQLASPFSKLSETVFDSLLNLSSEDWNFDTAESVGRFLAALDRCLPEFSCCSGEKLMENSLKILLNPKESPSNYSSVLICLKHLTFPIWSRLDVAEVLRLHYSWNQVVFHSVTPFDTRQPTASLSRVYYVSCWKDLVTSILRKQLKLLSRPIGGSELSFEWFVFDPKITHSLMEITQMVFGSYLHLHLLEIPPRRPRLTSTHFAPTRTRPSEIDDDKNNITEPELPAKTTVSNFGALKSVYPISGVLMSVNGAKTQSGGQMLEEMLDESMQDETSRDSNHTEEESSIRTTPEKCAEKSSSATGGLISQPRAGSSGALATSTSFPRIGSASSKRKMGSSGCGSSASKRRKKRATDVFEVTRAFRLRHQKTGLIFVFHQTTDVRVILDATTDLTTSLTLPSGSLSSLRDSKKEDPATPCTVIGQWWKPARDRGLFIGRSRKPRDPSKKQKFSNVGGCLPDMGSFMF